MAPVKSLALPVKLSLLFLERAQQVPEKVIQRWKRKENREREGAYSALLFPFCLSQES